MTVVHYDEHLVDRVAMAALRLVAQVDVSEFGPPSFGDSRKKTSLARLSEGCTALAGWWPRAPREAYRAGTRAPARSWPNGGESAASNASYYR